MSEKTCVYNKKEFVKTGRVARKTEVRAGGRESIKELVEIHPSNLPKENKDFDEWVDEKDLFYVEG